LVDLHPWFSSWVVIHGYYHRRKLTKFFGGTQAPLPILLSTTEYKNYYQLLDFELGGLDRYLGGLSPPSFYANGYYDRPSPDLVQTSSPRKTHMSLAYPYKSYYYQSTKRCATSCAYRRIWPSKSPDHVVYIMCFHVICAYHKFTTCLSLILTLFKYVFTLSI